MSPSINLDPVTNPASLCLSIPILALFVFLGYVAVAFIRDQTEAWHRREHVGEVLASFGVDDMRQAEFRRLVAGLLRQQGYSVHIPTVAQDGAEHGGLANADIGTDLIATKDGRRYAVFAIRYGRPLSPGTVREANENRARYAADAAMIVTNGTFGGAARKLAQATGCELVDREGLARWMAP